MNFTARLGRSRNGDILAALCPLDMDKDGIVIVSINFLQWGNSNLCGSRVYATGMHSTSMTLTTIGSRDKETVGSIRLQWSPFHIANGHVGRRHGQQDLLLLLPLLECKVPIWTSVRDGAATGETRHATSVSSTDSDMATS